MISEEPQITCTACGQTSDLWDACNDEHGNILPVDHFVCPACGARFYRYHHRGRTLSDGYYIPGKIEIRSA
jgi:predicted RNA-binding Zn-ribbon protein involved in translation (DUF1610 family)